MSRNPDTRSLGLDEICESKVCGAVQMTVHQFAESLSCIIAVADSLFTMLQRRPYREARSYDQALGELAVCAGTQSDPEVVDAFFGGSDIAWNYLCSLHDGEEAA
ncbi:MAG TPA: hypothetical protein VKA04_08485 [Pseudodesulfovibrio sp.]|nr:hypothetical protein [Pseudodesulfovibrio sp.]